jgi:DNA transformation protein
VSEPVSRQLLFVKEAMNFSVQRLRDLKNLGEKTEARLAQVGIFTPDQLLQSDPFEVYARLKKHVPGTSLVALYALIGAIDDQHWLDVKRERYTEILIHLDDRGIAPK